jgi:hypothetical protein
MRAWLGRIKNTWSWGRFAWQLAGALGLTGILGSIGGAVWAVIQGVPLPIALMVGYCTLVGAVYLAMAPLAYRALSNSSSNSVGGTNSKVIPDYKLWRHIQSLTVGQAAHLWNERDPAVKVEAPDVDGVDQLLRDAIKRGELRLVLWAGADSSNFSLAKSFPDSGTRIDRGSLKQFATKNGYDPIFLRDS